MTMAEHESHLRRRKEQRAKDREYNKTMSLKKAKKLYHLNTRKDMVSLFKDYSRNRYDGLLEDESDSAGLGMSLLIEEKVGYTSYTTDKSGTTRTNHKKIRVTEKKKESTSIRDDSKIKDSSSVTQRSLSETLNIYNLQEKVTQLTEEINDLKIDSIIMREELIESETTVSAILEMTGASDLTSLKKRIVNSYNKRGSMKPILEELLTGYKIEFMPANQGALIDCGLSYQDTFPILEEDYVQRVHDKYYEVDRHGVTYLKRCVQEKKDQEIRARQKIEKKNRLKKWERENRHKSDAAFACYEDYDY